MSVKPLVLGIDLGTSGVRIAVNDLSGRPIHNAAAGYRCGLEQAEDWQSSCSSLIRSIPETIRRTIQALAVDGTSGTLLATTHNGEPLGPALPYSEICSETGERLKQLVSAGPACSCSSSLARALRLLDRYGETILLRHQADWITGWLLQDWTWGEAGNNLRLGWDLETERWSGDLPSQSWMTTFPRVKPSGAVLGRIAAQTAETLGLPKDLLVVAGTTDSNAAVLAAAPGDTDGVTVLGTTLVMKRFTDQPIRANGVSSHNVGGRWLCGGASNAGAGVLRRFFSDAQLKELSRQIDPETDSGLQYRPLPAKGERFPEDDPELPAVLEPRPVSDALFLHGLLEGLAAIERRGWQRLTQLGAEPPKRVISIGGGARNPQWRRLRERLLGCPVVSCNQPPAAGVAHLAAQAIRG